MKKRGFKVAVNVFELLILPENPTMNVEGTSAVHKKWPKYEKIINFSCRSRFNPFTNLLSVKVVVD